MRAAALALLALGGCNAILGIGDVKSSAGGPDASPDAMADASPDAMGPPCGTAPSGSIVGCSHLTHVQADGKTVADDKDLSRLTFIALIPAGNDFTATTPVVGKPDGTFRVDNVPDAASYYLQVNDPDAGGLTTYFYTDQRSLDLSSTIMGRPGTTVPDATPVTLTMSNMSAWTATDVVGFNSFNLGDEYDLPDIPPTVGATTLSQTFDWRGAYGDQSSTFYGFNDQFPHLIDGAGHMDDVTVSHLRSAEISDTGGAAARLQTVVETFSTKALTMMDGQAFAVTGAFTPAPAANPAQITFDLATLRAHMNSGGRYMSETLDSNRFAFPGTGQLAGPQLYGIGYDVNASAPLGYFSSIDFASVPYTNAEPALWSQNVWCEYLQHRAMRPPGANNNVGFNMIIRGYQPASQAVNCTLPMPATADIKVGGQSMLDGGAVPYDGTAALVLSWDPVAGATQYQVLVEHVTVDASGLASELFVASINTATTSLPLPTQFLVKGDRYILKVIAYKAEGDYAHGQLTGRILDDSRTATGLVLLSSLCGNGTVDPGEQCDSKVDTASCNSDCTLPTCGDGHTNAAAGEVCDNIGPTPTCGANCKRPVCGDGAWNWSVEQCDDGNTADGDGCSHDCKLERCGTNAGILDPASSATTPTASTATAATRSARSRPTGTATRPRRLRSARRCDRALLRALAPRLRELVVDVLRLARVGGGGLLERGVALGGEAAGVGVRPDGVVVADARVVDRGVDHRIAVGHGGEPLRAGEERARRVARAAGGLRGVRRGLVGLRRGLRGVDGGDQLRPVVRVVRLLDDHLVAVARADLLGGAGVHLLRRCGRRVRRRRCGRGVPTRGEQDGQRGSHGITVPRWRRLRGGCVSDARSRSRSSSSARWRRSCSRFSSTSSSSASCAPSCRRACATSR